MRISFARIVFALTFFVSTIAVVTAADVPPKTIPPNIILIMADDMGMGDTSAYQDVTLNSDEQQIHTPNMDRLARMGIRFTDAHTPTSRCSGTRYGLLTGRYPWRNRLKHWVLYGVQGDPMIERDRPTIATLLRDNGYHTAMVGKWHVGLRYRRSDGEPAAAWQDADLTQPLHDGPLDHGFDYCRFTSRSHGTSGVADGGKKSKNGPHQSVGPGHIHGRVIVSATGHGKELKTANQPDAYVLSQLGSRHSDHSISVLTDHLTGDAASKPFFLYYASNSNHAPYTPDESIGGKTVLGAARNVAGKPMATWKNPKSKRTGTATDLRHDFIYENDVVLGRLLDYLQHNDDPRRSGHKLIDNTIVIFTSDNGAERSAKYATGPFRSNKGSAYEGGHRVPFIVAWPHGRVGDGQTSTEGQTSDALITLQDMFATFADAIGAPLPDLRNGEKGAEDSQSVLAAWRGEKIDDRPIFHNDHSDAKDHAAMAIRLDIPAKSDDSGFPGKWKLFFDADLLRSGIAQPTELYDLATDPQEQENRLPETNLKPLVEKLTQQATLHRNLGGHRQVPIAEPWSVQFHWGDESPAVSSRKTMSFDVADEFLSALCTGVTVNFAAKVMSPIKMQVTAMRGDRVIQDQEFHLNERGLGVGGGKFGQVDDGEAIVIRFDKNVLVESAAIVAGNGQAGGFYQVGDQAPLAIYCVDDDIDAQDQSGILSDIGVLKAGEPLRLDSRPHYGVEAPGRWRLGSITIRLLQPPAQARRTK